MARTVPTPDLSGNEQRTRLVVVITAVMMVVELIVGTYTNSMALTADGWHMATHAGALGLTLVGYWYARSRDGDPRFNFGTGKVFSLTAFASAMVLGIVALEMIVESGMRLMTPLEIDFTQALPVAIIGLLVNLVCAVILQGGEGSQGHGHSHGHSHGGGQDENLRAAYLHVLADALTSVLAIFALIAGRQLGWAFLDPLMGVVGGLVITRWAWGLSRDASRQLLDMVPDVDHAAALRAEVEAEDVEVSDLFLWTVGPGQLAAAVTVVDRQERDPIALRQRITDRLPEQDQIGLVLVLIEITRGSAMVSEDEVRHDAHHDHGHGHHH
ncbi:MAG: cation diffusion facilitator family transporter [Myxococcota bacterium]|jgi:cation diffusion facilitator family transporter